MEPEPYSFGSIFQWHPVLKKLQNISFNTSLNAVTGHPIVFIVLNDFSEGRGIHHYVPKLTPAHLPKITRNVPKLTG